MKYKLKGYMDGVLFMHVKNHTIALCLVILEEELLKNIRNIC